MPQTPGFFALPEELRAALMALKGHAPSLASDPFPLSAEFARSHAIPDKGIYLGSGVLHDDRTDEAQGDFAVYAAPYDLGIDENGTGEQLRAGYGESRRKVCKLRNLLGHDGMPDGNNIGGMLRSGRYGGEWFIPTSEILLRFIHPARGDTLRGTFQRISDNDRDPQYWSSTSFEKYKKYALYFDGRIRSTDVRFSEIATRLVRIEPASP
jgi:hypothetical protein